MSLDLALYVDVDTGRPTLTRFAVDETDFNITHNVAPMWQLAGVYDALYNSDGTPAGQWVDVLANGVRVMGAYPAAYETLNPPNGWGTYEDALRFLKRWLAQCERHPKALIEVLK